ncbi:hypothetical protein KJ840_03815 [Patescibacteria group bacterium]|nr:hypothetical protein [Patescibacteria group bacterium]
MAEKNKNNQDRGQTLAKWNFPEFEKPNRTKSWYFWAIITTFLLLLYAILTINFLFAVIIVIAAITLIIKYQSQPELITFAITEDGLELEKRFYPWEIVKDFYIIYKPSETTNLYLNFKAITKPRLTIPLQNQSPVEIRKILTEYIDEDLEKEEEPFSEAVSKLLKL